MSMQSRYVEVEVDTILKETDAAFLLGLDVDGEDMEVWVPRSVVHEPDTYNEGDEEVVMEIQRWFADKEELPYDDN